MAADVDLSGLSLEELANLEITSVSRRPERISQAAAAVYVLNSEEVRRSGATSLPEVLRLAPNLQVQRVNAADYAISARGFNGFETSNKLLVLIDGRSIYSTLHSGVFWDIRTPPLEDLDRIEVVSGPGGTLFGANAVNGVINVISQSSFDTQGTLLNVGAGDEDKTLTARQGWRMGENGAGRAYVYAFDRDTSFRADGSDATDDASGVRGGFRTDWTFGANTLSGQGEIFRNRLRTNEDFSGQGTHADGAHLLARWTRDFAAAGQLEVQAYYDKVELVEPLLTERNDTYDLHFQHAFSWGDRHELVWGGGYREAATELVSGVPGSFLDPQRRTVTLGNVFVQDQIALAEALTLTLGVKYETNNFSGEEILPNARLAWRVGDGHLLWGAVSRASRTPNRIERDLRAVVGGVTFLGGGDFQSERLTAYELGYRSNPTANTAISVSAFYNDYDNLRTVRPDPATFVPIVFANDAEGRTYGMEAWGSWDVRPRWRLSAGVSTLDKQFELKPGASDISNIASIGNDPDYQVLLRSQSDITDSIELDLRLRAVGELDRSQVDDYVEADARIGWHVTDNVELAVTGQNLLDDLRLETQDTQRRRYFGRSVYANLRMTF
ncbi:MAG TPA: TonB-dependent receptor [Caulobacteraceae bacterium]|nr:TonB-dependent receptor [Caulobacteraceae bacterium]